MARAFTSEDDEQILQLVNVERLVYREVADAMGRTTGSVCRRIKRLREMGYEINPARSSANGSPKAQEEAAETADLSGTLTEEKSYIFYKGLLAAVFLMLFITWYFS